jgi:hypothetical protein
MANQTYRQIELEVTEADIERGSTESPWYCPIALALKRTLNKRIGISVSSELTIDHVYIKTPARLSRFMVRFDSGKRVKPFKFTFRFPA